MYINQGITYREADKILRVNGFNKYSCKGDHVKYRSVDGKSVVISRDLNAVVWQRICKQNNLTF